MSEIRHYNQFGEEANGSDHVLAIIRNGNEGFDERNNWALVNIVDRSRGMKILKAGPQDKCPEQVNCVLIKAGYKVKQVRSEFISLCKQPYQQRCWENHPDNYSVPRNMFIPFAPGLR